MRNFVHVEGGVRDMQLRAGGRAFTVAVGVLAVSAGHAAAALATPVRVTDLARGSPKPVPGVRARILTALANKEAASMSPLEKFGSIVGQTVHAEQIAAAFANVTEGKGAVGPVTTAGDRSMVPLMETMFAGGYGGGGGLDQSENAGLGGGGGGASRSRTIAVVEVAPDGVTVQPVIDKTAVTLAAIAAGLSIIGTLFRARRRR